jgi:hypothetical protein
MYSACARKPSDVRFVCRRYMIPSTRGLMKCVLPPIPANSVVSVSRLPVDGKIG